MKTRIDRLDHPRIHVQTPPSRTAHLVGNIVVEEADEAKGEYVVGSTLIMAESREDKQRTGDEIRTNHGDEVVVDGGAVVAVVGATNGVGARGWMSRLASSWFTCWTKAACCWRLPRRA